VKKTNAIMVEIDGGVTAPKGFVAGGIHCGVRKSRKDLAILLSKVPATVAAVFTTNRAAAAPVLVCRQILAASETTRALVVNSGNANACTGERGENDAWSMVNATAASLGVHPSQVMVSSTGVIGEFLPIKKIIDGISCLAPTLSTEGGGDAAQAIMTTDTVSKECAVQFPVGASTVTIGAMAKGSGMIHPNMATMLAFVTTDATISRPLLQNALSEANRVTFNRISVDGDTSTNDMVLVMANGLAGGPEIVDESESYTQFRAGLEHVLTLLAKMIASDGEGASKLIEVAVEGAATEAEGEGVARAIAGSALVKTAVHGADANWGRIVCAVGYSDTDVDPSTISLWFNDVPVLMPGYEIVVDEERATEALRGKEVLIRLDLGRGNAAVRYWTCDLTREYVTINASYRT